MNINKQKIFTETLNATSLDNLFIISSLTLDDLYYLKYLLNKEMYRRTLVEPHERIMKEYKEKKEAGE